MSSRNLNSGSGPLGAFAHATFGKGPWLKEGRALPFAVTPAGGEIYAKRPYETPSPVSIEQRLPVVEQAEVQAQARDPRYAPAQQPQVQEQPTFQAPAKEVRPVVDAMRPAVRAGPDERPIVGDKFHTHPKIIEDHAAELGGADPERGFMLGNRFLTREEAAGALGRTEPLHSEHLAELQGGEPVYGEEKGRETPVQAVEGEQIGQEVREGVQRPETAPRVTAEGGVPPAPPPAPPSTSLGPGAASREEYMKRYSLVGASHLARGVTELGMWSQAMVRDFGTQIADQLPEIFERSKQVINEFQTATGKGDVAREINRQVQITKPLEKPILVRAFVAQKAAYLAAQKAGTAGYTRGLKEARAEAKAQMSELKANMKVADRWMAADQDQVRRNLIEYVNTQLPPAERGRFNNRIAQALKRPALGGDFADMYRRAFDVMKDIEERSEQVYRDRLIDDIKHISNRALDSPTVDLDAKRLMQKTLQDINLRSPSKTTMAALENTRDYLARMAAQGKDVYMPQEILESLKQLSQRPIKELPTAQLDDLHTKMRLLEKLGRMKYRNRVAAWDDEKAARWGELEAGPSAPKELRGPTRPQPGETLTIRQRQQNWLAARFNTATGFDLGTLPMDVHFDMAGGGMGTYEGPLFDHIRTPIDAAYDRAELRSLADKMPLLEIIQKYKLGDADEDLIGLWATLQQPDGEARAKATGVFPETIEKLRQTGLTQGQQAAYDYMRKDLDAHLAEIQDMAHELYNIDVASIPNYFPWMRDWEIFNPSIDKPLFDVRTGQPVPPELLHSFSRIVGDFYPRNTARLPQGFIIDRATDAKTPIRFDAFSIYEQHVRNRNRFLEMQRPLKMVSELIRSDVFARKYGGVFQKDFNDWVTSAATDGTGGGVRRWSLLDMTRRGATRSMVFFRLTSNIKHISSVPQAMFYTASSPHGFVRGISDQFTKDGTRIIQAFPQIFQRQAGDMSMQELQNYLRGPWFSKALSFNDRWGFVIGKEVDAIVSRAVFLSRYVEALEKKGIKSGLSGPINYDAAYKALPWMRRTVSSTLAKDLQPTLVRGAGFSGNVSMARTFFAFKQYGLERYSLLRYDVPKAFQSGNYTRGAALIGAALLAGLYETNIAQAVRKGWHRLAGINDDKVKQEMPQWEKITLDTFGMFPGGSTVESAIRWGETGVPLVDAWVSAFKDIGRTFTAKTPEGTKAAIIRSATAAGIAGGFPAAGQLGQIAEDFFIDREKMKQEAAAMRRPRSRRTIGPPRPRKQPVLVQ